MAPLYGSSEQSKYRNNTNYAQVTKKQKRK